MKIIFFISVWCGVLCGSIYHQYPIRSIRFGLSVKYTQELFEAVAKDDIEKACLAVNNRADIHAKENVHGYTALHIAALHNAEQTTRYLMELGVDGARQSDVGDTALDCAVMYNADKTVKILVLKQPSLVHQRNNLFRQTPLHEAALRNLPQIAEILIHANANINTYNSNFKSPLCLAVERKAENVIKVLLNAGAEMPYNLSDEQQLYLGDIIFDINKQRMQIQDALFSLGTLRNEQGVSNATIIQRMHQLCGLSQIVYAKEGDE